MRCGIGRCGHCHLGPLFTCLDGPVLTYDRDDHAVAQPGLRRVRQANLAAQPVEVVARHVIDPVAGRIACGDQLREPGLVVGRIVE